MGLLKFALSNGKCSSAITFSVALMSKFQLEGLCQEQTASTVCSVAVIFVVWRLLCVWQMTDRLLFSVVSVYNYSLL